MMFKRISLLKLVVFTLLFYAIWSCRQEEERDPPPPPRDRTEVYNEDITEIEEFLQTHYMEVDPVTYDVEFFLIPENGTQTSIWDQTQYPLQQIIVKNDTRGYASQFDLVGTRLADPVDYKLYHIILNEGGGEHPQALDSIFASLKGVNLNKQTFENIPLPIWFSNDRFINPQTGLVDGGIISGLRQFSTKLKTASNQQTNPDGTVTFNNFGAGIVFIPSGLAYFNFPRPNIPAYAPIIFNLKLKSLFRRDSDGDGIINILEDLNNNGNLYDDDTDGDGIPNFLDNDDDGDGVFTRREIRIPDPDNPNNCIIPANYQDIPNCQIGTKVHLDKNCRTTCD